ncbi:S8 family peptidase [Chryseobacterium sp. T20]|uniref:S8 family peptidase n=1 Tax=Chryseobacterium sp. T20 TaxID=3395375 RepID=UPI0039BC3DF2
MKKTILLVVFSCVTIFGQSRKNQFQLQTNSDSHTLYICFSKEIKGDDIVKQVLNQNPEMATFIKENGISFTQGLGFDDRKLNEMYENSRKNKASGESVQKLKRIYKVQIPSEDNKTILKLAEAFEKFKEIEYASIISNQPIKPPFTTAFVITPDLENLQTYLNDNPGINAKYAWSKGITGQNIRVRDVEYGFYKTHEMLSNQNSIQLESGYSPNAALANNNYRDHGTAVVSILGSIKDNIGLTGAAYNASEIKGYMEWTTVGYNRVSAVSRSINASQAGDIILYEMQTGGVNSTDQNPNYVPAEYENLIWDLTKAATDSGIIIIAAAGNGNQNLNDPSYANYTNRGNSGAIIVGAGYNTTEHSRLGFSTYGSRVDVQGWGTGVLSAGYGSYAKYDNDANRTYIMFSGTSSATPVVASAAILIQSFYYQTTGGYMTPSAMKNILVSTGIPQGGDLSTKIGPLPNVKAAILQLEAATLSVKSNSLPPLEFEIYPNPAYHYISVKSKEKEDIHFEIINMAGQIVLKGEILPNEKLDISQLVKGNYIFNATEGSRRVVEKFIKL